MKGDLPHHVVSYDVMAQGRLYSATVAKAAGQKLPAAGRDLWDGGRIREIREARGYSQEKLSELTGGVSKGDISRHERNDDASNPSVATLVRIALALDVPPSSLFEPIGTPFPDPGQDPGDVGRPNRAISELERARLAQLEAEAPVEDDIAGDIQLAQHALASAQDALNRALRRAIKKPGAA